MACLLLSLAGPLPLAGQDRTVGTLLKDAGFFEGYTLFNSLSSRTTWLVDGGGRVVNSWTSDYVIGNTAYLMPNGDLLRTADPGGNQVLQAGGDAGRVERFDWEGNLIWEFDYNTPQVRHHHDIAPLPNGNVLILAWEYKSEAEAIAAGRNPALLPAGELWPEHLVEVQPEGASGGTIVWEWHAWDHLIQEFDSSKANFGVVADHPERIHINFVGDGNTGGDWMHGNSVDYNPELDQILISIPNFGEFWIIDHNTTTAEAAGPAGDLLYRWGNPQAYGAGDGDDTKLVNQHDVNWIDEGLPGGGNILVFNNRAGDLVGQLFSSVDEIVPPLEPGGSYTLVSGQAFGPEAANWRYMADNPPDFSAGFLSGAQRLPNGNTLICAGPQGIAFEVTPDRKEVWRYVNPDATGGPVAFDHSGLLTNRMFRATRYPSDYPGVLCRHLQPGDPVEIHPAAAPLTSPPDYPGNVLWLDANDPDGDGNPGGVFAGGTTWTDKSAAGNADAVQVVEANRPVLAANAFNSRQVARFDGVNDFLDIADSGARDMLNQVSGATLTAVLSTSGDAGPQTQRVLMISTGSDEGATRAGLNLFDEFGASAGGAGDAGFAGRRLDSDGYQRVNGGSAPPGELIMVTASIDFGNGIVSLFVNGVLATRIDSFQTPGETSASDSLGIRVGADAASATLRGLFSGELGELIVYNRMLTDSERRNLESWLSQRWFAADETIASWKNSVFSKSELADPDISGDLADADGDGLNTVVEFATGSDPTVPDRSRLPKLVATPGGAVTLSYHQRRNSAVHLCPESSKNLVDWIAGEGLVEISRTDHGDGTDLVTVEVDAGHRKFVRLAVRLVE